MSKTLAPSAKSLPSDVTKIDGFIYNVPFDLVQIMAYPDDEPGDTCKPINARHLGRRSANKPLSGKGMSPDDMDELLQSIRDEGWFGTHLCRWASLPGGGLGIELVAGERRLRCEDKLRKGNIPCRDRTKDKRDDNGELIEAGLTPASKLFATLRCEIFEMTDEEAQVLNFLENDKHVGIGEGASIAVVKRMRVWGWNDDKITRKVKKCGQWLRETDVLIALDPHCFQAICQERVNRNGALLLARIPDVNERVTVCDDATENAWNRARALIEKRETEVKKAEQQEDMARIMLAEAQIEGKEGKITEAAEVVESAIAKTDKKMGSLKEARGKAAAKSNDVRTSIRRVSPRSNSSGGTTPLRPAKIQRFYMDDITELLKTNGKNEHGVQVADLRDLYLLQGVIGDILAGNTELRSRLLKNVAQAPAA